MIGCLLCAGTGALSTLTLSSRACDWHPASGDKVQAGDELVQGHWPHRPALCSHYQPMTSGKGLTCSEPPLLKVHNLPLRVEGRGKVEGGRRKATVRPPKQGGEGALGSEHSFAERPPFPAGPHCSRASFCVSCLFVSSGMSPGHMRETESSVCMCFID